MSARLISFLALMSVAPLALADVLPLPPKPPPPKGPAKAVVRGVGLMQDYRYWRGRRWLTVVDTCAAGVAACAGGRAQGCVVTAVDGKDVEHGRLDLIQAADKAAAGRPLSLALDGCKDMTKIELGP